MRCTSEAHSAVLSARQDRLFWSCPSVQGKQVTLGDWNDKSTGPHPGGQTSIAGARRDLSRPLLHVPGGRAGAELVELGWTRRFPPLPSADHC